MQNMFPLMNGGYQLIYNALPGISDHLGVELIVYV